jgi:hypothetical protein
MTGVIPPGYLVTAALLSRYNVPSAFLAQFGVRPFSIQISTGGALGTMQFIWQYPGDSAWSAPIVSAAGATWLYTLDDVFADLTFAARTYVLAETYSVDAGGTVTGAAGLTAARFSLVTNACSAVTAEAMQLMRDAIRPPLLTWGDDAVTHAAAMVYAVLKRGRGLTPDGAGEGDSNLFAAERIARQFFKDIGENGRPDSMTDSSPTSDGPLIAAYPSGDTERGW